MKRIEDIELLNALEVVRDYCNEHLGCYHCILHDKAEQCDLKKSNTKLNDIYKAASERLNEYKLEQ